MISCDLDPAAFQVLVAKGVHAPVAAYGPVCNGVDPGEFAGVYHGRYAKSYVSAPAAAVVSV